MHKKPNIFCYTSRLLQTTFPLSIFHSYFSAFSAIKNIVMQFCKNSPAGCLQHFQLPTAAFHLWALLLAISCGITNAKAQKAALTPTDTLYFSLAEAQKYAAEHNLRIQMGNLDVNTAQEYVREIKSIGLPQVSASAGYTYNIQLPAQLVPADAFGFPPFIPLADGDTLYVAQNNNNTGEFTRLTFGTKNNLSIALKASQLIFDGSYTLGLKAADHFVERAQNAGRITEYEIKTNITDAYTTALLVQENIGVFKKNITTLEKVLYETSEYQKAGFAEKLDVDRLTLSLANLRTKLKAFERNAELAIGLLKFHMGIDLQQPIVLRDKLLDFIKDSQKDLTVPLSIYISEAWKNRAEMRTFDTEKIFAELDIKQIKAKYLPNVVGFLQTQAAFQSNGFNVFKTNNWVTSALVGLQVNVPIFDGFQKKAQYAQRLISQQKLFKQEEQLKQVLVLQIAQAHTQYISAKEALDAQQNSIDLAQRIYDTALVKYKAGVGASLEITDAEAKLYETQALYISALYDLVTAKNALYKALGR